MTKGSFIEFVENFGVDSSSSAVCSMLSNASYRFTNQEQRLPFIVDRRRQGSPCHIQLSHHNINAIHFIELSTMRWHIKLTLHASSKTHLEAEGSVSTNTASEDPYSPLSRPFNGHAPGSITLHLDRRLKRGGRKGNQTMNRGSDEKKHYHRRN